MVLTPVQSRFILHWGEMGTRWGINRTVAQIHALLFVSPEPLSAEEIAQTLSVARSNVSTSLRELQVWGIAQSVHKLGDRRDFFRTQEDVWEIFRLITQQRKEREVDPTLRVLEECVEASRTSKADAYTHRRLSQMLDFMQKATRWYERLMKLPTWAFATALGLGKKPASRRSEREG